MPDKDNLPWVHTIRRETGLVELVCKCGVGHPAPASVHWMELHGKEKMGVHGCCGCCSTPEWKLAAATQGYQIANKLLKDALYKCKCAVRTIDELHKERSAYRVLWGVCSKNGDFDGRTHRSVSNAETGSSVGRPRPDCAQSVGASDRPAKEAACVEPE